MLRCHATLLPPSRWAMPQRFRSASLALLVAGFLDASLCAAAELRLRESLLQAQRDRVSIAITAVVDHLGAKAHDLAEDCDLHVPLRSREIQVPLLGEVKNACSFPPGVSAAHWSDRL